MSVNGISTTAAYEVNKTNTSSKKAEATKKEAEASKTENSNAAVTYEKTENTKKTSGNQSNKAIVDQMKSDMEARNSQLRSLVEKMMTKQGQTYNNSTDIFKMLREGKLNVDPATAAKAKEDISEKGYWGVEQTSERLVSFAKALAGDDPEKADKMIAAVKKGFDQATRAWGSKLPDICQRTLDTTIEKLDKWKAEINGGTEDR